MAIVQLITSFVANSLVLMSDSWCGVIESITYALNVYAEYKGSRGWRIAAAAISVASLLGAGLCMAVDAVEMLIKSSHSTFASIIGDRYVVLIFGGMISISPGALSNNSLAGAAFLTDGPLSNNTHHPTLHVDDDAVVEVVDGGLVLIFGIASVPVVVVSLISLHCGPGEATTKAVSEQSSLVSSGGVDSGVHVDVNVQSALAHLWVEALRTVATLLVAFALFIDPEASVQIDAIGAIVVVIATFGGVVVVMYELADDIAMHGWPR